MRTSWRFSLALFVVCSALAFASVRAADRSETTEPVTIRCAVIGGMTDTAFWPALSKRFEEASGERAKIVAEGPKQIIIPAFRQGKADLIVMHASDAMINLVADGYGADPQPWAKNDQLIVGPASDPAGIRGMDDAAEALRQIVKTKSNLLIQRSAGCQEVLFDVTSFSHIHLDWDHITVKFDDEGREMLKDAAAKEAYTIVGRIPFLNGKIPNYGLEIMVRGDPRFRRPYLVVTVNPSRTTDARAAAARRLAEFLRCPETQAWIAGFGRGALDERPLFFPIETAPAPSGHSA